MDQESTVGRRPQLLDPDGGIESFCRSAYPRLVRTLSLSTGDSALAREVTQEALARAWERWDRVSAMESPEAWCYRVAINLATSQFRRRAAERRAHARVRPDGAREHVPASSDESLRAAVGRLPEQQRHVIVLRFLADASVERTAEILGIPTGTVKSATSRALAALREHLGQEDHQ